MSTTVSESERQALIAEADVAHAQYPQYRNHWDDWTVVEMTKRISARGRVQFEKGDRVLCSPETQTEKVPQRGKSGAPYSEWPEVEFAVCYSARTGIDTLVRMASVRRI